MKRWSGRSMRVWRTSPSCPPNICWMPDWCASLQVVDSPQQYGVTILGPTAKDSSWQAHTPGAFDKSQFQVDWERQVVTCPMGKASHLWLTDQQGTARQMQVFFNRDDCLACGARAQCTRAKKGARVLSL